MEALETEKPLVKDLNQHIVCPLCRGYLIDATTLAECLHSFCRGCIVRRLSSGARACPVCNVATSPPLLPDTKLQRLVYLLVPGLFRSELERRRHFREINPQCPPLAAPFGALDLTLDDLVSLSLREITNDEDPDDDDLDGQNGADRSAKSARERSKDENSISKRGTIRYLKCPAAVTGRHLIRLLMLKRGWEETNANPKIVNRIEIMCRNQDERGRRRRSRRGDNKEMRPLNPSWTLLDLACIFGWNREAPMKLYYRIVRQEESDSSSSQTHHLDADTNSKDNANPNIENIQRPPTPPPSPKSIQDQRVQDSDSVVKSREKLLNGVTENQEKSSAIETCATTNSIGNKISRPLDNGSDQERLASKAKKPRCEVTPVMRSPDPIGLDSAKTHQRKEDRPAKEQLSSIEHRKRRKRRNKRVIAEITTTPREDLLKLKVRLTPCPPRITSASAANGQTKEKLLQMRAVRREKIKASTIGQQQKSTSIRDQMNPGKESNAATENEETIEEIIDGIPDEVVTVAQNIAPPPVEETKSNLPNRLDAPKSEKVEQQWTTPSTCRNAIDQTSELQSAKVDPGKIKTPEPERPKKDEEILRRLGLVAIDEANESLKDKSKQRTQNNAERSSDSLDREKLEKQLRESKANRVRSLLAEKQMRDALKSIMSKNKGPETLSGVQSNSAPSCPKKKGPPPLAPLRVAKQSVSFTLNNSQVTLESSVKYEKPLDLSHAGIISDNALDLSATLVPSGKNSSISSSSLSSSTSSSPAIHNNRPNRPIVTSVTSVNYLRKTKDLDVFRRNPDTNLRTLSDAAVSLLSGCIGDKTVIDPLTVAGATVAAGTAGKVALRIPQPHHRISAFGMKIKPNLGMRHIPNPQAVVASQYRNQRANYFNALTQQPP